MTEHRGSTRGDESTDTPQEGRESASEKARARSDEATDEQLQEQVDRLADDPPENLEDWPDGAAKYKTFGGPEGDHSYEEGPERSLGPSSLRRHEDGSIEIEGEPVDNPEDYKRESIEDPLKKQAEKADRDREAGS